MTDSLFNKWCWENWTATHKRMKLEHFLKPHTKINSKWIKDLNIRPETVKLLEESTGRILDDISQSKILYDPPHRVMEIKTKVNKWDLAGVQPWWIQGIRSVDGVGVRKTYLLIDIRLD